MGFINNWNPPDRRVTQANLMRLVHLATKKRPDKMRLAADPIDLLKSTPTGKARWQAILLSSREKGGGLQMGSFRKKGSVP